MRRSGFTLLELLLVLAILGSLVAIVAPHIGAGMAGAELATASRSLVQASKYARTMAILHQAETELVLTSAKGETDFASIEVRSAADTGSFADETSGAYAAFDATDLGSGAKPAEDVSQAEDPGVSTNLSAAASAAKSFADEVSSTFKCKGVSFSFEGYDDNIDADEEAEARNAVQATADGEGGHGEYPPIRIAFRSNGTCRPFTVRLRNGEEFSHVVKVDFIGSGKIEEYGDE